MTIMGETPSRGGGVCGREKFAKGVAEYEWVVRGGLIYFNATGRSEGGKSKGTKESAFRRDRWK